MPDTPAPPPHSEETPPPEYSVTVEHCMEIPPLEISSSGVNNLVQTTAAPIVSVGDLIGSQSGHSLDSQNGQLPNEIFHIGPQNLDQAPEIGSQNSSSFSQTVTASDYAKTGPPNGHSSSSDGSSSQNSSFNGSTQNSSINAGPEGCGMIFSQHNSTDNSQGNSGSSQTNAENDFSPNSSLHSSHLSNPSQNSTGNSSQSSCGTRNSENSATTSSSNSTSVSSTNNIGNNSQSSCKSAQNSSSLSQNSSPSSLNRSPLRGSQICSSSLRRSNSSHSRRSLRSGQGGSPSVECLVENIAPINQETVLHLTPEGDDEKKDTEV